MDAAGLRASHLVVTGLHLPDRCGVCATLDDLSGVFPDEGVAGIEWDDGRTSVVAIPLGLSAHRYARLGMAWLVSDLERRCHGMRSVVLSTDDVSSVSISARNVPERIPA